MMKALLMVAVAAVVSGCGDMPTHEVGEGFKEEKYAMTGSRIPRKSTEHSNVAVMDKNQMEQRMNSPINPEPPPQK